METVRTWSWIPLAWASLYAGLMAASILLSAIGGGPYVLGLFVLAVPVVVIPLTYRKLVGGACSLRFHICALVKGILIGFAFVALSLTADTIVQSYLLPFLNTGLDIYLASAAIVYQVWLVSAMVGGFGARIAEIRGETVARSSTISIVKHE